MRHGTTRIGTGLLLMLAVLGPFGTAEARAPADSSFYLPPPIVYEDEPAREKSRPTALVPT